jgi:OFA family oxalate/formate antiporter-like MFS transporter
VLGAGYIIAGQMGASFNGILLGVGIIGGAGIGLAYVVPIAVGVKWFPDKKGLITGLAVAGFGFGALIWIMLASGNVYFAQLLGKLGLSAETVDFFRTGLIPRKGVSQVFTIFGVAFAVLVVFGSIWMKFPPEGWKPAGWNPPAPAPGAEKHRTDLNWFEMLGTPQFYMLWLMFACGALAGLMVIGIIKLFSVDALTASGFETARAGAVAGVAMGVFYALFNGVGRIAWGAVSDKLGRKTSLFF